MNPEKLRQYALVGAQERLQAIASEIDDLREAFPRTAALKAVREVLASAILAMTPTKGLGWATLQERPSRTSKEVADTHPDDERAPSSRHPSSKRIKAVATKVENTGGIEWGYQQSWITGREVLSLLAQTTGGMDVASLMSRLNLAREAMLHRLKVRKKHGHVITDASSKIWDITPAGRKALETDKDSVLP